ncbi:unnamed protein product [Trichogramma brassicae]|uniref:Uncharacterized protein n=1 Tax=Trichogramma brassicae TaxID=86971 RepID=A0A6H5IS42_9HYME|nr:unnamed protein product [Trichogramma brassicae]
MGERALFLRALVGGRVNETAMRSYYEPLTLAGNVEFAQYRHFVKAIKELPDLRIEVVLDEALLLRQAAAANVNNNNDNAKNANVNNNSGGRFDRRIVKAEMKRVVE